MPRKLTEVDVAEGAGADLPAEAVVLAHVQRHGEATEVVIALVRRWVGRSAAGFAQRWDPRPTEAAASAGCRAGGWR